MQGYFTCIYMVEYGPLTLMMVLSAVLCRPKEDDQNGTSTQTGGEIVADDSENVSGVDYDDDD